MKTKHHSRRFRRFLRANEAVSALEYAILVGVVAVGIGIAIGTFSDSVESAITDIGTRLATSTTAVGTGTVGGGG